MSALTLGPPGHASWHICNECEPRLRVEGATVWCPCGAQITWVDGHAPAHNEGCTFDVKWCERCGVRGARPEVAMCGPCNSDAFQALGRERAAEQVTTPRRPSSGNAYPRWGGDPNAAPWSVR